MGFKQNLVSFLGGQNHREEKREEEEEEEKKKRRRGEAKAKKVWNYMEV